SRCANELRVSRTGHRMMLSDSDDLRRAPPTEIQIEGHMDRTDVQGENDVGRFAVRMTYQMRATIRLF
ncbi:hypothetical protein, partial [Klebsiella pneumoniae]|uniref:hypothetical protein n=1 Tax=Klebsiella pneumoniae TaxID=573 RepID=UPI001953202A